ncbi:MAG TPA: hypothetical protein VLF14_06480 [Candidatus Binatia bacterium]|nr:hypothetical protein [Candidatus Binatia bacterium]
MPAGDAGHLDFKMCVDDPHAVQPWRPALKHALQPLRPAVGVP